MPPPLQPKLGYSAEFDRCRLNGTRYVWRSARKWAPNLLTYLLTYLLIYLLTYSLLASRLSKSFKIIVTNTDQSGTYDFLLTFHSKHDIYLILAENCDFSPPPLFNAAVAGVSRGMG